MNRNVRTGSSPSRPTNLHLMNFIVSSTALHRQLSRIAGVIPSRSVLPIIENFLFEIGQDTLTVSTTNLDTSMQTRLLVEARGEAMRVAIPAKILLDILKALPEQPLTFVVDESTFAVEISSENGKYKISAEDGADFPTHNQKIDMPEITISERVLRRAIDKTLFATSTDKVRAALNGVFFELGEQGVTFVATDAFRLSRFRSMKTCAPSRAALIVSKKALSLLQNVLDAKADRDIVIQYNENNISFRTENLRLVSRLIDDQYPDHQNIIPPNNPNKLFIAKQELMGALRRVNIFANKSTHEVRFTLKGSELKIYSEDPDFANEARENLKCHYEGKDLEIGFNAALLIEVVQNVDTEELIVEMSESKRAAIIRPNVQDEGEDS